MRTHILTYPLPDNSEHLVSEFVENVKSGGVIGYPTETVYGLGGDALNPETTDRIYRLKGRDFKSPLLVLIRDREMLLAVARTIPPVVEKIIQTFWPGPLTLVLEKTSDIPDSLTGDAKTVGVRMSPDPVCRFLFSWFGRPLISTSANPSGAAPARSASEVTRYFGEKVDWIIDGGERVGALPSTVLDVTHEPPSLIREGGISKIQLEASIGVIR